MRRWNQQIKTLNNYYKYAKDVKININMMKKVEYIKKTQIKHLEIKNIISDVNNKLNEISCRLETAEEKKIVKLKS